MARLQDIRARSGCFINIERENNDLAGQQPVIFSGTDAQVQHALALVRQVLDEVAYEAGGSFGPGGGGGPGPGGGPHAAHMPAPGGPATNISCPKEWIGRVVGPRGATVQQIRQSSAARSDVPAAPAPVPVPAPAPAPEPPATPAPSPASPVPALAPAPAAVSAALHS